MPRRLLVDLKGKARIDLDLLYLPFCKVLLDVLADAADNGADYYPTRGTATFEFQAALFAAFQAGTGGRAAPPGLSAHNYGLAVDLAPDGDLRTPGLQPVWNREAFDVLGAACKRHGLVWGASFNDRPHVQWPGFVSAAELVPLRSIYLSTSGALPAKLAAVWSHVDRHSPAVSAA